MKEKRYYLVDGNETLNDFDYLNCSDEEFIVEAECQGYVFSEDGFVNTFNNELGELAAKSDTDLSKHLNDACFAIDVDYQTYYSLDADNWDIVYL